MTATAGRLKIAKDTLIFTAATLVSQSLSVVLAIFIRRELGPEAMGIWALLQVVISYVNYSSLGMVNAVCRQIPTLRGRGEPDEKIRRIKNLGYTYLNGVAILTFLGLVAGAFIFRPKISDAVFIGLFIVAAVTMLERSVGYLVQILYADKKFTLVSRFRTYSAFVNAALTFFLVKQYHLYGFYAAVVLSFCFDYFYLKVKSHLRFHLFWDRMEFWDLLKFGIPICILAAGNTLFFSMDKLTIGKFLGLAPLGVYTLALMAGRYIFLLPNIFHTVLLPSTLEKFGNDSDREGQKNAAILPGRFLMVYFSLFLAGIWIGGPYLCRLLLPKYVDGIPAMKALIFGYVFMSLFSQTGQILLGLRRHTWTIPVVLVLSAGVWGANAWIAQTGGGLLEMALSMTTALFLAYLITSYFALNTLLSPSEFAVNLALNLLPLAYAAGTLMLFDHLWPVDTLFSVVVKSFAYLVLWFLLAMALEKKTGVLGTLRGLFWAWLGKRKMSFVKASP